MASIPNELIYGQTSSDEEIGAVIPSWQLDEQSYTAIISNNSNFLILCLGLTGGFVAIGIVACIVLLAIRFSNQLCGAPMTNNLHEASTFATFNGKITK